MINFLISFLLIVLLVFHFYNIFRESRNTKFHFFQGVEVKRIKRVGRVLGFRGSLWSYITYQRGYLVEFSDGWMATYAESALTDIKKRSI